MTPSDENSENKTHVHARNARNTESNGLSHTSDVRFTDVASLSQQRDSDPLAEAWNMRRPVSSLISQVRDGGPLAVTRKSGPLVTAHDMRSTVSAPVSQERDNGPPAVSRKSSPLVTARDMRSTVSAPVSQQRDNGPLAVSRKSSPLLTARDMRSTVSALAVTRKNSPPVTARDMRGPVRASLSQQRDGGPLSQAGDSGSHFKVRDKHSSRAQPRDGGPLALASKSGSLLTARNTSSPVSDPHPTVHESASLPKARITEHDNQIQNVASRLENSHVTRPSRVTNSRTPPISSTTPPLSDAAHSRLQKQPNVLRITKMSKSSVQGSRSLRQNVHSHTVRQASKRSQSTKEKDIKEIPSTAPRLTVTQALLASRPPKVSRGVKLAANISFNTDPSSRNDKLTRSKPSGKSRATWPEFSSRLSAAAIPRRGVSLPSVWADMLTEPLKGRKKEKGKRKTSKSARASGRDTMQESLRPEDSENARVVEGPVLSLRRECTLRHDYDANVATVTVACPCPCHDTAGGTNVRDIERLFRPRWAARLEDTDVPKFTFPMLCGAQHTLRVPGSPSVPVLNASTSPSPCWPCCVRIAGIPFSTPSSSGKSGAANGAYVTRSATVSPRMRGRARDVARPLSTLSPPHRPGLANGLQAGTCSRLSSPTSGRALSSERHLCTLSPPTRAGHHSGTCAPLSPPRLGQATVSRFYVASSLSFPSRLQAPTHTRCESPSQCQAASVSSSPTEVQAATRCSHMRHRAALSAQPTSSSRAHPRGEARDALAYAPKHMHSRWAAVNVGHSVSLGTRADAHHSAHSAPPVMSACRSHHVTFRWTPRSFLPHSTVCHADAPFAADSPTASCFAHPVSIRHPMRSHAHGALDTPKHESLWLGAQAQSSLPTARTAPQSVHSCLGGPAPHSCWDADAVMRRLPRGLSVRRASPAPLTADPPRSAVRHPLFEPVLSTHNMFQSAACGPSVGCLARHKVSDVAPTNTLFMAHALRAPETSLSFAPHPRRHDTNATAQSMSPSPHGSTRHKTTTHQSQSPSRDPTHPRITVPSATDARPVRSLTPQTPFALPCVGFDTSTGTNNSAQKALTMSGADGNAAPNLGGLTLEQRLARAVLEKAKSCGHVRDETLAVNLCRQVGLRV